MATPPAQSFAVQLGYSFTPAQSPPPELELDELEELDEELEELELLDDELLELDEELLELDEDELLLEEFSPLSTI